jgi:hypothetical protein
MPTNQSATDAGVISATSERLFQTVEALFGRPLTDAERLSFTTQLAGLSFATVQPGDLITADLFNSLRADLNDLATRLAIVEQGSSGPVISRAEPAREIEVGGVLTLVGSGFDPATAPSPLANTRVVLGGIVITQFEPGSGNNRLILRVPESFTLLPLDVEAVVRVGATSSSNPWLIRLLSRPLRIERIEPAVVRVRERMTVFGSGFDPDRQRNAVFLDNQQIVTLFNESNAQQLIFDVPPSLNLTVPRNVAIRVETGGRSTGVFQKEILPERPVPQRSVARITPQTSPPVTAGQTSRYVWQVLSDATAVATYNFTISIGTAPGAPAWAATLLQSSSGPLQKLATFTLSADIAVPVSAQTGRLNLSAVSTDGLVKGEYQVDLVPGQPAENPDAFAVLRVAPDDTFSKAADIQFEGTTRRGIIVLGGTRTDITASLDVAAPGAGTYQLLIDLRRANQTAPDTGPDSVWTTVVTDPPPPQDPTKKVEVGAAGSSVAVSIILVHATPVGANSARELRLRAVRDNADGTTTTYSTRTIIEARTTI